MYSDSLIVVQSDQGKHFASQVFEEMCKLNGMKHRMGSVGHAQSQGQVERQNQLLNQVKALCDNNLDSWPEAIIRVQHAHNTSISPHEVIFAQKPNIPENMAFLMQDEAKGRVDKVSRIEGNGQMMGKNHAAREKLKSILIDVCRENTITHQDRLYESQESKAKPYSVGSLVRLRLSTVQKNALGGKKLLLDTVNLSWLSRWWNIVHGPMTWFSSQREITLLLGRREGIMTSLYHVTKQSGRSLIHHSMSTTG